MVLAVQVYEQYSECDIIWGETAPHGYRKLQKTTQALVKIISNFLNSYLINANVKSAYTSILNREQMLITLTAFLQWIINLIYIQKEMRSHTPASSFVIPFNSLMIMQCYYIYDLIISYKKSKSY